jgi:hypothetical protein
MPWLIGILFPLAGSGTVAVDCSVPGERPDSVVITGRVVNAADARPVAGAVVRLIGTGPAPRTGADDPAWSARSDDAGCFSIVVAPGHYVIEGSHEAYATAADSLRVASTPRILRVTMRLQVDAVPLRPLTVEARVGSRHAGLYDRIDYQRRLGAGHFLLREDIERHAARTVSSVLLTLPGTRLVQQGPIRADQRVTIGIGRNRCSPTYFINGVRFRNMDNPDLEISLADVEAIEVYRSASQVPVEFTGARCVIAIWLR